MHPPPGLVEAPPKSETPHPGQQQAANGESPSSNHNVPNGSHENHVSQPDGSLAPMRKDTNSSTTSTTATVATLATLASNESATTAYSGGGQSPSFASQAVFSVADGTAVEPQRRASRRRTGPLTAAQREKAALIRKLGACQDCRRRRVACHPNHHGMSWEDATRKFRPNSPSVQDLAPLNGQHSISPAPLNSKPVYTQDPQEMDRMDVDVSPTQQQAGRPPLSEARIRTPLPSGPRPDKLPNVTSLPPIDGSKVADIQAIASRIITSPWRGRYASATALLVHWQDDDDRGAYSAMEELGKVLSHYYNYTFDIKAIPVSPEGCKPFKWLSQKVTDFMGNQDQRDVLKIVYYSGHSYLDSNRDMVLSSPKNIEPASAIRWSGIQSILENVSSSDTLIIMDSAYYPSAKLVRQEGVLELIAASTGEEHLKLLERSAFTRILTDELKMRASQKHLSPLSAAELHAKLVSYYPRMIQDRNPEKEILTSFPSPFHLQMSGNARLPSILLAPLQKNSRPYTPESPSGGAYMALTFRLPDEAINPESWAEFFRWVPEGVRDIKVEGPYRNTFR